MLNVLELYSNQVAQEVHEVYIVWGPHEPLEQVNWSDIQAYLTRGPFFKVGFLCKFDLNKMYFAWIVLNFYK